MSANPSTSHTGGGGSSSGGGSGGGGGPCGACKFLRRKCVAGCIFAPYFDSEQIGAAQFAAVHKVFGASNVSKLLFRIPSNKRMEAVVTICYEAQARIRDPVYGCLAHLFALQQQVANLQAELSYFQTHLATLEVQTPLPPPQPPQLPSPLSVSSIVDLPTATCPPTMYDLSILFDPMIQPSAWAIQPSDARLMDHHQFSVGTSRAQPQQTGGGGESGDNDRTNDLHELARELLRRQSIDSLETSSLPSHTT
ncbi:hypothetical protein OSB04_032200 [Centaurea solstitialis]|uniref:LOB domain-containing protein n=1 Tax=Centaurea solstitialis TaxID=347529 RepID=A0AA38VV65_9ASTR|nr:hypothetical protein OSB04_032200 [Centaurea solstitialis]